MRLRTRVMVSFALGAALLSILLSGATYLLTRRNLLEQRETAAVSQAYRDAQIMLPQVTNQTATSTDLSDSLQSVVTGAGSHPVIEVPDRNGNLIWGSTSSEYGLDSVPASLQQAVQRGEPGLMRVNVNGQTTLAIGMPLPSLKGRYYELVSLQDIEDTLNALTTVLLITMAGTTVLGIFLGWWVSRRVLRPLSSAGLAAEAIARGRLGTRLDESPDPDLEVLVESFNHMAAALEGRIEQDARFTSDVSHELRSPLMTLAASMEVIESRRDEIPEGPLRSAIDLMSADLARFQQLVEDLLEISRYDAGAIRLDLSEIPIVVLVLAVTASLHLDVPVEADEALAHTLVRVDKRRLSRVIANLLDNANKYGGGATRVEISMVDDRVRLAVEDNGPGVPESDRQVVFDRFSRGSASGRRSAGSEGVGLGLALVSEHLRLQGGDVWVEDRPDGQSGARFVVDLAGVATAPEEHEELVS
jgi:signal transduction histidine kinase